jgi:endonuclease YncB( thermonuclease family)
VVDGDTIKVVKDGQPTSVRILGLDAEETFHGKKGDVDRQRAEEDFDRYAREMRGTSPTPVKFGTPAGVAAKEFAHEFFHGVRSVRLERDEAGRDTDGFGRLLMHVFAVRLRKDSLYAEELIRAGLSPYFVKYGRSKRFDARFAAAMKEAQAAKRGVFGDAVKHYPDYAERLAWWEERAKQVDAWDAETAAAPGDVTRVRLGVAAETDRLPSLLGKRVTLFASLDRVDDDKFPKRLLFVDKPHDAFPVVVFDDPVWAALDLARIRRGYSRISGTLSEFHGHLQIKLSSPGDLR